MIILKRWKAILGWAAFSAIVSEGMVWLSYTSSPHWPDWVGILLVFAWACSGAAWCTVTE